MFKIERDPGGERLAHVRMFSGTMCARDRVTAGGRPAGRVTGLSVDGAPATRVGPGGIALVRGLADVRVGDAIGSGATPAAPHFAPPTLSTVVVPARPADRPAMRAALNQLAEQDPLIDVRQDDVRHEISLSLYGEVQKEVVASTLATEYGVTVTFRDTTPICVERPVGTGESTEVMFAAAATRNHRG